MEAGKHETSFVLVGKITSAFSPALFVDRAISVKTKTGKPSAPREHAAPSRPARRGSCPAAPVGGGGTSDPSLPSYKKHMQQGASSAVRWREGGTHLLLAYADRCCTLASRPFLRPKTAFVTPNLVDFNFLRLSPPVARLELSIAEFRMLCNDLLLFPSYMPGFW